MSRHRRLVALIVAGLLVALTSMAYASPPDPPMPGIWDDGDYDNVVELITDQIHGLAAVPLVEPGPLVALATFVEMAERWFVPAPAPCAAPSRAPPLAAPVSS
ncbi:MAG: hypothetical protein HY294_13940 [Candidatus Rokubacteria bacterium]|nr:hypothetical protein [Candidatus Rokubacteria bacterium]MBI3827090.1 hypothetical protein [Candidatus Rokubacteria bacterium]